MLGIPTTLYVRNGYVYDAADLPNGALTLFLAEQTEGTPTPIVSIGGTVVNNRITIEWPGATLRAALVPTYVNRQLILHRRTADENFARADPVVIVDGRPDDA